MTGHRSPSPWHYVLASLVFSFVATVLFVWIVIAPKAPAPEAPVTVSTFPIERHDVARWATTDSSCDRFGRRIYVSVSAQGVGMAVVDKAPECPQPPPGLAR